MKTTTLAVAILLLAGCAAPPTKTSAPPQRTKVVLTQRAFDEIAAAKARELALHALSHIGVPYRFGGNSPEAGFDCSGLVQYVYGRGAGVALPRNTQSLSEVGAPVAPDALEPGDLVFFDTLRRPYSHVGIYLGDYRFIHAPTTGGQVELVDLRDRYWQTRFNGARRLAL
jgi:cell wall-associated NlpC family hydrolase